MSHFGRQTALLLTSLFPLPGICQTATVGLQTANTTPGGSATMPLVLSGSAGPAALEWTLSYGPDITNISVGVGPASLLSSKSLSCATYPGQTICVLSGVNQDTLSDGVIANVSVQISQNPSTLQIPVQLSGVVAATAGASALAAAGYGSAIGVIAPQPSLVGLSCTPTSVTVAIRPICTLTLDQPAPSSGISVSIVSSNPNLSFPTAVTVGSGLSSATFAGTVASITAPDQPATVTATLGSSSLSTSFVLSSPAQLASVTCSPTTVFPGTSVQCTVTLDKVAAGSAATVSLTSNNANVAVPASVQIVVGGQSATFAPTIQAITGADQQANITASLSTSRTATLTLSSPPQLATFACSPMAVYPGTSVQCTVTLDKAAAGSAATVSLTSNNVNVAVPASVQIAVGGHSATFTPTIQAITGADQQAGITATLGTSQTATLVLSGLAQLASLMCSPTTVFPGTSVQCTLTLDRAVVGSAAAVPLTSTNANVAVPASVQIAEGGQSATFAPTVQAIVGPDQQANITATLGTSRTAMLTLSTPAQLANLVCSPTTMYAGTAVQCTVTLDKAAGTPTTVSLTSNNTNLTVPASVSVAAGTMLAAFQPTVLAPSGSDQTVAISATLGSVIKEAVFVVAAVPTVSRLSCREGRVFAGMTDTCTVALTAPASTRGLEVSLSSDSASLLAPTSVSVAGGQTSAQFTITASEVSADSTATLTALVSTSTQVTAISVVRPPLFYLRGNTTEVIGGANGSPVTPVIVPGGLNGNVVARGAGYVTFAAVQDNDGVSFRPGGAQNANTAFFSFSGPQVGKAFKAKGEVRLKLRSSYSFTERNAMSSPNDRTVFDVFDATGRKFTLVVLTQNGRLVIRYATASAGSASYVIPSGQEDVLFGKGVVLNVRLVWDGVSNALFLNGVQAATNWYSGSALSFKGASSMTVGAQNSSSNNAAGAYSLDDAVADLEVR